jgi:hypothetical protein
MNEESYNRIRDCLEQLEAGPGCYGQVCRAYYTALCEKWDTVYPTDTLSVSDTHREDWDTFCDALKECGLHQDYRVFFDYFAPEIVQDWSGLCDLCDDVPSTILTVLAMLLDVPPLVPLEMPETEVEAKYLDYESLLTAFGMDLDAFRESWYCVHLSQLQDSKYFPKPAVQQAKQFYHENYLPMADLLSDYATLRLSNTEIEKTADYVIYIPETNPYFADSLAIIPLQLFAYYVSVGKGCDVDKPRNLAKSVTVE